MLKTYFKRECTQTTYSAGPAGPYLDDFSHWLAQRGFSPRTVRDRLFGARQFASWAEAAGVAVQELNPAVLNDFRHYLAQNGQLRYASGNATVRCLGAQHFLTFLRAQGLISASAGAVPSPASPILLREFWHWMHVHRGVTQQTLRNYSPIILDVLTTLGDKPAQFTAIGLRAFVLERAHQHGMGRWDMGGVVEPLRLVENQVCCLHTSSLPAVVVCIARDCLERRGTTHVTVTVDWTVTSRTAEHS